MKKLLLFRSNTLNGFTSQLEEGYCKENIQLIGFKEVSYQGMIFDVAVDGELYNEKEIQEELAAEGFPHAEHLEEIFLYAYLRWSKDAMRKLEGAYSFTIKKGSSIIVVKDPMGLMPIFYLNNEDGFWMSNQLDTLLAYSKEPAVLNKEGIMNLFAFGPSIPEDETLFQNIKALPMGAMLTLKDQTIQKDVYYTIPVKPHTDDIETTVQKVHDLVEASILQQMKGCKASFLSGGLDSSIITSVCARARDQWNTYSLDYEGNAENFKGNMYQVSLDQEFIEEMIKYCECSHTKLSISQEELCDLLQDAMSARNMPGMADVDSSLLWLCKQVAQKESCILSGECSDELFGGYPWFYRDELKDLDTFPWLRSTKERISLLHPDLQNYPIEDAIDKHYKQITQDIEFLDTDSKEDQRARIHTILCLHWFMQTLVTRQVCMSDAAHLTIRAPFANVKLLEYVYNIPWKMKFLQDEEKGILRKAFEQELPECVAHRKKNPFPKTHNPQYAKLISEKLRERYEDPDSPLHQLFDDVKLKELIDTKGESFQLPWYGQLMSGPQLLAYLYQIDQWIIKYHIIIEK